MLARCAAIAAVRLQLSSSCRTETLPIEKQLPIPHPPPPPGTHHAAPFLREFNCSVSHTSGTARCLPFRVRLISLSETPSRFVLGTPFLFQAP